MRISALIAALGVSPVVAFQPQAYSFKSTNLAFKGRTCAASPLSSSSTSNAEESTSSSPEVPAPVLDGKRVLPYMIMAAGLKGHRVAAVYAVLGKRYKRGSGDCWDTAEYVGVSQDLGATLALHASKRPDQVAHVRALSFSIPQPNAMQEIASDWKKLALDAGATMEPTKWEADALEFLYDEDDDDNDDEFDMEMLSQATASASDSIVSPKEEATAAEETADADGAQYEFTEEGVDKVLDEVRPYLIADGGNISVEGVNPEDWTVTLKLEGACGSCSSSTVTMQMGVERVLREKFPDLKEVLQVEQDPDAQPQALDFAAVKEEVTRLSMAITAMGGQVELLSVDPELGVAKVLYRGPNKVQQGIELALLDVPFVKHVEFVMDE